MNNTKNDYDLNNRIGIARLGGGEEAIQKQKAAGKMTARERIDALLDAGEKVVCFPLNGTWIDIGTPQEYKRANDMVKFMH